MGEYGTVLRTISHNSTVCRKKMEITGKIRKTGLFCQLVSFYFFTILTLIVILMRYNSLMARLKFHHLCLVYISWVRC